MIRKNVLRTLTITALTAAMALTACSSDTGTTPQTQPRTETAAPETTAPEQSGGSLTDTGKPETTEKETKEDSSSVKESAEEATTGKSDNTEETTTAEQTASTEAETTTEETATEHVHNHSSVITTEASCTSEGIMTYTCECGDTYTEGIPAVGHSFGAYTYNNDATDLADGTETAVCSVCGASDTRTSSGTKLPHEHNYVGTVTMEASCTHYGIITYTCSCGDSYEEMTPVIWHTYENFVYNNDATDRAPGTETGYCIYCGSECKRNAMYSMPEKNEYEADLTGVTDIEAFLRDNFVVCKSGDIYMYEGEYIGHIEGYAYADIPWDTGYYIKSQGHWNGPELDKLIGNVEDGMEMYYVEPYYCNNEFMYVQHWGWSAYDENLGWYDEGIVRHRFTYPNGADPIAYYNDNFNR